MFLVYFGTGSAIIALGIFGIHSDVPIIIALGFGVAAITAVSSILAGDTHCSADLRHG